MRVIPAHAGSTHSKPQNPANAATLAAATDATGHPVEQPSVSDRARAEGLDRGGGENGAIKKSRASVQGAAQSPPATPCEPGHQKPEVSDMDNSHMPQGNMLVWPYDAEKPP